MSATGKRWAGWVTFSGWLMLIIGGLDFLQGLIAAIRGSYYAITPNQIIVFDLRTWGWLGMIWGVVLAIAGLGLLSGSNWARWFAIVVATISFFGQLGFSGFQAYPLWALASLFLTGVVLYALIVRWGPAQEEMATRAREEF
jgi:hypothetical protein